MLTSSCVLSVITLQVRLECVQCYFHFLQAQRSSLVVKKYRCHLKCKSSVTMTFDLDAGN